MTSNPSTTSLLVGVLPRGDEPDGDVFPQPNKYSQSIKEVNAKLQQYASTHHQVVYVECEEELLTDGQVSVCSQTLHRRLILL